ncbi:MAG: DUF6056 family protein [Lachnospiraceae bacterium]
MKKFEEKLHEKKTILWMGIAVIAFMLVLNCMTQYTADDYSYHYSMLDGSPVNSIPTLVKALYDHYFVQNGRILAHFFAYIFLMMPKMIFNVVNALMFGIQIYLIYRLAQSDSKKQNAIMFFLTFAFIWLFQPAFGQVNLWLDGACNYLFAVVFSLLFFYSFAKEVFVSEKQMASVEQKCSEKQMASVEQKCSEKQMASVEQKSSEKQMASVEQKSSEKQMALVEQKCSVGKCVLACIFSFLVGGYTENISFCLIFGCILILLWKAVVLKRKIRIDEILRIVSAVVGYAFLALSPSTIHNKSAEFSISIFICNFKDIFYRYYETFLVLLVIWVVALVVAFYCEIDKNKIFLSVVCMIISLCSALICMVAKYLSDRSLCGSTVFLILAVLYLLYPIWETKYQIVISAVAGIITMMTVVMLIVGVYDIMWTYNKTARREAFLRQSAAEGKTEVYVEPIDARTMYSASYRLPELNGDDPTVYPNIDYERYYGIDVILCEEVEE